MHGRLKVKTDSQKQLEKQKERQEKANQFLEAQKIAFQMRLEDKKDKKALELTGQLVAVNPDFYTIWNYRREILLSIRNGSKADEENEEFAKICRNELQLTENCLRVNPKSYCVWHQRRWVIEQMPDPDLKMEISLCNQCLQLDERNFHCWDYRRFICKLAKTDVSEELKFSRQKIEDNFSNFSSWYYRSCLFTSAANNSELDFTAQWKQEYDLVENAIFTDPSDQSAWFYHKWLVSTDSGRNMKNRLNMADSGHVLISRIVLDLPQRMLIIHMSRPLKHKPLISVTLNDEFLPDVEWNPSEGVTSKIWWTQVSYNQFSSLSINPCPTFAPNPDYIEPLNVVNNAREELIFVWERKSSDCEHYINLDDTYFESLRQLHKMEPNNKWVNLTLAWNDPNYAKTDNLLEGLIKLDPLRVNYYNDLKSKRILKERVDGLQTVDSGRLSGLKLTACYHFDRLSHIRFLDLSDNNLLKLSKAFNELVSLEILVIDSNKIYTIDKDLKLNKLRVLSLNKNHISELKVVMNLKNTIHLETLFIKGNPVSSALKTMTNRELLFSDRIKIVANSDSDTSDFINQYSITDTIASESMVNYNLF